MNRIRRAFFALPLVGIPTVTLETKARVMTLDDLRQKRAELYKRLLLELEMVPIAQVWLPNGHHYRVWYDGRIEGFGDGAGMINLAAPYLNAAIAIGMEQSLDGDVPPSRGAEVWAGLKQGEALLKEHSSRG